MYNNIVNYDTSKKKWEKIEILCEGTEEVRYNQRRILISKYEDFMANPKECITDVFERFNKLINDLQLHDKYYEAEEMNLKFFLTLPDHLEQKISAIREGRDLSRITLEVLYGILKTYELEMIQRKSLRSVVSPSEQRTNDSQEQVILELEEDEFYTLDELDELDQSMVYLDRKFSNIRVKKTRYFKCHFVTECRKPKKAKKDKAYPELEAKYEILLKKQQSKAYIAEGKSWDDSENDEDEEFGNYALMVLEQGESSSSKSLVPTLTTIDLNVSQYNETVEKMSTEMFHIHTSMVAANEENKLKCANEIEEVLREKLEKNEVKLKSFRNASELVGQYHEKNKPYANIAIGLDYDALHNKKKEIGDKGKATVNENVPSMQNKLTRRKYPTLLGLLNTLKTQSLFVADLDSTNKDGICCFYTKASEEQSKLWHKKLSHLNFKTINTLVKKELVRDMPKLEFAQVEVCEACQKGKIKRSSHKSKTMNSISAPLQLIHMDLFGPVNVLSILRNEYALVMVDDFSRYTWVEFMYSKDETPHIIIEHIKKIEKQTEDHNCVKRLRSDNET
ncbi:hypothetical protein AgCh_017145 [Apium graveolens]